MKKIKILFVICFVVLAIVLSVRYPSKQVKIECPQEVHAATSNIVLPFDRIPALKASLEITGNGTNVSPRDIGVQLVRKQASRANSPLLIQLSQVQLNDVPAGTYDFKVTLKRADDNLPIAILDMPNVSIHPGANVDFSQTQWNYDLDDDGDHYNNITEIMNGEFGTSGGGNVPNLWVSHATVPTGVSGENSSPSTVKLLRRYAISVTAPGPAGIRVVGDPFSVQSGVWVIADLLSSTKTPKSRSSGSSRIDGSFDLPPLANAAIGDLVQVHVASQHSDGAPSSLSLSEQADGLVQLIVKDSQACL